MQDVSFTTSVLTERCTHVLHLTQAPQAVPATFAKYGLVEEMVLYIPKYTLKVLLNLIDALYNK
jgi:hypothetical protein